MFTPHVQISAKFCSNNRSIFVQRWTKFEGKMNFTGRPKCALINAPKAALSGLSGRSTARGMKDLYAPKGAYTQVCQRGVLR